MNQRIQELAHDAGLPTYNPNSVPTKLEKFARLLIEECASRIQNYVDHRIPASQYPELLIEELGGNVIKTRYVEMMCRECGKPTMHMGDRCYGCIQAAQRLNNND